MGFLWILEGFALVGHVVCVMLRRYVSLVYDRVSNGLYHREQGYGRLRNIPSIVGGDSVLVGIEGVLAWVSPYVGAWFLVKALAFKPDLFSPDIDVIICLKA